MKYYQFRRFQRGPGAPAPPIAAPEKKRFNPLAAFMAASWSRKMLMSLGTLSFTAGIALLIFGLTSAFSGGDSGPPVGPPVVKLEATPSLTPVPTHLPLTQSPAPTPRPSPPLPSDGYQLIIDKLGVVAPVQEYGLDENQVPEVPEGPGQGPGQIVAWYDFSARPGTGSNAVFAGHVTWNGPAVFYNLTTLAVGDTIVLRDSEGVTLTYKVAKVFSVDPSDPNSTAVMSGTPTDQLTIITCDGTTTYVGGPFGVVYNARLVVQAQLLSATPAPNVAAAAAGTG